MEEKIVVVGSGGHSRSVINLMEANGFSLLGIFDESFNKDTPESIGSYMLRGCLSDVPPDYKIVLAIGENKKREILYQRFGGSLWQENILHPTALVERYVKLGRSNLIFAKVYLNSYVSLGENNIVNTGAIIEHEATIGSHNHISVGSIICGRAVIGDLCFVGSGAVVIDKISITSNVTIGAHSVVVKDITLPGIYVGNPAKKIG